MYTLLVYNSELLVNSLMYVRMYIQRYIQDSQARGYSERALVSYKPIAVYLHVLHLYARSLATGHSGRTDIDENRSKWTW